MAKACCRALQGGRGPGEVIGEYLAEGAIAPLVMIRRDQHKFVHSPVDPDQLYDLVADPDERVNLAAQPDACPEPLATSAPKSPGAGNSLRSTRQ